MKNIILLLSIFTFTLQADTLKIAVAAGYKKPLMEIITKYKAKGNKIEPFFGNMRQVTAQSKQTDIALIIGDKNFLSKKSKLDIKEYVSVGKGKVVIVYAKGVDMKTYKDLGAKSIKRISIPQPKKAIYGIAGLEFLKNSKLYESSKDKLYIVSTVPQALTYVIAKEVNAGIINLTAVLSYKDKIGGYIEVNENFYTPIQIVAGVLNKDKAQKFLDFLQTENSLKTFKKYGL